MVGRGFGTERATKQRCADVENFGSLSVCNCTESERKSAVKFKFDLEIYRVKCNSRCYLDVTVTKVKVTELYRAETGNKETFLNYRGHDALMNCNVLKTCALEGQRLMSECLQVYNSITSPRSFNFACRSPSHA